MFCFDATGLEVGKNAEVALSLKGIGATLLSDQARRASLR
jgi:hypothetical protein